RMTMSYNTTTSIINAGTYVDYRDSTTLQYFLFEINYDFNTKTLNSFSILGLSGTDTEKTSAGVRYYTFENNTLKVLDNTAESFEPFAQEILAEMEILSTPERETNPADYSAEYIAAMNTAQGE
ncbi:MAG: hypothetical protein IJZ26_00205, partial [Clostridia bacterium]|nr:hypothetical protein [Clostridia bacterium]